ncbi:MAG TPA: hypothetical protein PLN64_05860 [Candidatus Bipolaricaulis anaerobius]|mgnify:CR=1 FL=1|nr:hypothetical protein [Candidatus Bipolaricaulis anaerobius]
MATVAPVTPTQPPRPPGPSLAQLAGQAWDEAGADFSSAVSWLVDALLDAPETLRGLVGEIAWEAIGDEMRRRRASCFPNTTIPRALPVDAKEQGEALRAFQRRQARDWLAYPVRPGVILGDATRPVIREQIAEHERNIRTNTSRARFLGEIASRMPDDFATVREVLTNDEIQKVADGDEEE